MPKKNFDQALIVVGIALGTLFTIAILVLVTTIPTPSEAQYTVYRIVLAAGLAGFAMALTGFIRVELKSAMFAIKAGGPLAVFLVVYFFSPGALSDVFGVESPSGVSWGDPVSRGDSSLAVSFDAHATAGGEECLRLFYEYPSSTVFEDESALEVSDEVPASCATADDDPDREEYGWELRLSFAERPCSGTVIVPVAGDNHLLAGSTQCL